MIAVVKVALSATAVAQRATVASRSTPGWCPPHVPLCGSQMSRLRVIVCAGIIIWESSGCSPGRSGDGEFIVVSDARFPPSHRQLVVDTGPSRNYGGSCSSPAARCHHGRPPPTCSSPRISRLRQRAVTARTADCCRHRADRQCSCVMPAAGPRRPRLSPIRREPGMQTVSGGTRLRRSPQPYRRRALFDGDRVIQVVPEANVAVPGGSASVIASGGC